MYFQFSISVCGFAAFGISQYEVERKNQIKSFHNIVFRTTTSSINFCVQDKLTLSSGSQVLDLPDGHSSAKPKTLVMTKNPNLPVWFLIIGASGNPTSP